MTPMSDMEYLYVAYTVISLGIFIYLVYLHTRQAELQKQLESLRGKVKGHGAKK
jgi:CcmD family protein